MYVKCVYVERLVGKYTMTHHEKIVLARHGTFENLILW